MSGPVRLSGGGDYHGSYVVPSLVFVAAGKYFVASERLCRAIFDPSRSILHVRSVGCFWTVGPPWIEFLTAPILRKWSGITDQPNQLVVAKLFGSRPFWCMFEYDGMFA